MNINCYSNYRVKKVMETTYQELDSEDFKIKKSELTYITNGSKLMYEISQHLSTRFLCDFTVKEDYIHISNFNPTNGESKGFEWFIEKLPDAKNIENF